VAFDYDDLSEPHATRNVQMRQAYPKLFKTLKRVDYTTGIYVVLAMFVQIGCAYLVTRPLDSEWQWWARFLLVAYSIGGICNHSMTLAMHEISHDLAGGGLLGKTLGLIANAPLGIPAYASFKRYHNEHHKYQGEDGIDSDVPTALEGHVVGTNPFLKTIWMICQPFFYALRPLITVGKSPSVMELYNLVFQVAFSTGLAAFCGSDINDPATWSAMAPVYLIASTLLGMGLHPMAGHFVAEHYTFVRGQETYSYYGPLNWFSFWVGYHNEHHDFCNLPGSTLRKLRDSTPEFYEDLPVHHSWIKVIWRYITSPILSPFSRVRRNTMADDEVAYLRTQ